MTSSDLVLYRSASSNDLNTRTYSSSLISSGLFSRQTGTAIATELIYRILFDIINRVLISFQRLASRGIDEASSFIKRRLQERRERLTQAKGDGENDLKIVEEVGKLAQQSGFITCPRTGQTSAEVGARGPPAPPTWVQSVLKGIEEGRMHKEDFQTNQW